MRGEFSHFGNVLDLCAVAVPAGAYPVSELHGKPDGEGFYLSVSRFEEAAGWMDGETLEIARRFNEHMGLIASRQVTLISSGEKSEHESTS